MEPISQFLSRLNSFVNTIVPGALVLLLLAGTWLAEEWKLANELLAHPAGIILALVLSYVTGLALCIFRQEVLWLPQSLLIAYSKLTCKLLKADWRGEEIYSNVLHQAARSRARAAASTRSSELSEEDVDYLIGASLAKTPSINQVRRLIENSDASGSFAAVFALSFYAFAAKLFSAPSLFQLYITLASLFASLLLVIAARRWAIAARLKAHAAVLIEGSLPCLTPVESPTPRT